MVPTAETNPRCDSRGMYVDNRSRRASRERPCLALLNRSNCYDEAQRAASAAVFGGACAECLGLHGAAGCFFFPPFSYVNRGTHVSSRRGTNRNMFLRGEAPCQHYFSALASSADLIISLHGSATSVGLLLLFFPRCVVCRISPAKRFFVLRKQQYVTTQYVPYLGHSGTGSMPGAK